MASSAEDVPTAARPPKEPPSPGGTPSLPGPSADPGAAAADRLTQIMHEIRDELGQITARELELRKRERDLGRRYRSLRDATNQAASHEPAASPETLAHLAAELNAQAVDIAARQARVDEVTGQLRAQTAEWDRQRTGLALPARVRDRSGWRLRSTVLAGVVAVLAGLAWFAGHPPVHRATTRIQIVSENPAVAEVAAAHRGQLLDPHLLDALPAETGLTPAWQAACADGRVTTRTAAGEPVLWLSVIARDAATAHRLTAAACTAYTQRLQDERRAPGLPPGYRDLLLQRERLETSLQAARQRQATDEAALTTLPALSEREEVSAAVDGLEAELTEVVAALERGRTELAALAATDVPRGSVAPAQVEQALAQDAIYREDQQEFRAVALQYRTELAVALLQLDEPGKVIQKALAQLAATLEEQRALDPPADVAAALVECLTAVSATRARFNSFTLERQAGLDAVQKMAVGDDVGPLVAQQTTLADAAQRAGEEAGALVDSVGTRIEALGSGGDGGTRRVVVAAVLKADHDTVKSAAESFGAAAAKTTLAENFRLDAHDRKLRGLRMRLNSRREAINQQLQLEADRAAGEQYAAQVSAARDQVRESERRREELLADLVTALRRLRAADEAARRRDEVTVQRQQGQTEMAWLEARRAEMDRELTAAQQHAPAPDRAEIGVPTVEAVTPGRVRSAIIAGAVAFAATWLLCALMVARIPWLPGRAAAAQA